MAAKDEQRLSCDIRWPPVDSPCTSAERVVANIRPWQSQLHGTLEPSSSLATATDVISEALAAIACDMHNLSISLLLLFLASSLAQSDYSCSETKPCSVGCCSKTGVCGLGPKFCGKGNCTSSCDAKSECDPGWGMDWSSQSKCPLNVCCSKYGFCGTTQEFCGDAKVSPPSCPEAKNSSSVRTIGYYEGWTQDRRCDAMMPEDIPTGSYTHINFAFALVDPLTFQVAPMLASNDRAISQEELYKRTTALKESSPGLQVWISIGGWSMNDADQPTFHTFSRLASSSEAQQNFSESLESFMQTYGFDGVDIDWEYPVATERGGKATDYGNYVLWLTNLRTALGSHYGLSITLPSSYWYMKNFAIVELAKVVDWFNIMVWP